MTQDQRPAQNKPQSPQPNQSQQADSLVASYHAAQYALDAETNEAGGGTAGPSAQTRTNILAYAAQQPHVRARDAGAGNSNTVNSIAASAVNTAQTGQFDGKKPSANDSQWKLRALASVAIFGISGLLFMQWDRATPEEKDLAFSTARPAPAVRPKAEAADAPSSTPASSAATSAINSTNATANTTEPSVVDATKDTKDVSSQTKPEQSAAQPAKKTALPAAQQSPLAKPPIAKKPGQETADSPTAGALQQPSDIAQAESKLVVPQPTSQAKNSADRVPTPAPAAAPAPGAPPAPVAPSAPAADSAAATRADAALSKSAPSGAAMQSAPAPAAKPAARAKSTDAERPAYAGAAPSSALSASPNTALFTAIRAKDLAALQQALADGADKNAKSGGTPAITLCTQLGQADMVRTLAAAGADVNATDAQGITALDHARGRGFNAVMDVLLKFGAR
jgi:hypothetical protein